MQKKIFSDYFSFTKKERTGVIVLLVLILFFITLPFLYPLFIKRKKVEAAAFKEEIAKLKIKEQDSVQKFEAKNFDEDHYPNYYSPADKNYNTKPGGELFYFDPNTATVADWKKLGLRDKTIATIQNYITKGGRFYKPEDIGKIWGLHPDEVERLLPYVQITAKENNYPAKNYETKNYERPRNNYSIIDLNTTDTAALIALPGIGSKLAQRIINFRDKLGGFYTTQQVAETFGLPDSTFQKIKERLTVTNAAIKKINLNTATVDEMKAHPYIRYNLANAIIQYRTQHGNFTEVAAVKNIMLVTEELFNKIAPYLTTQ